MNGLGQPAETESPPKGALSPVSSFLWRSLCPSLQTQYLGWIADCFAAQPAAYRGTFPLAYGADSNARFYVAATANEPIALVCVLPLLFQYADTVIRVGCVGSVCVGPQHRGQGYAQVVLDAAVSDSKTRQLDLLCLFASDTRLYAGRSFQLMGQDGLVPLAGLCAGTQNHISLDGELQWRYHSASELTLNDRSAVWRALERWRGQGMPVLSWCDFQVLMQADPFGVLLCLVNGALRAVLFFEKGIDFQNTWHGLAADGPGSFLAILLEAARLFPASQVHLLGEQLVQFRQFWPHVECVTFPAMMVRALNPRGASVLEAAQVLSVSSLLSN